MEATTHEHYIFLEYLFSAWLVLSLQCMIVFSYMVCSTAIPLLVEEGKIKEDRATLHKAMWVLLLIPASLVGWYIMLPHIHKDIKVEGKVITEWLEKFYN